MDPVASMSTGQDEVLTAIRNALTPALRHGRRVVVGLSGGLDSVVLLYALTQLRDAMALELSAVHVHHGLSPNADDWAAFCETLCDTWHVPCAVTRVQLPDATGKGIERVAREGRYAAFEAATGDVLCLAHHENDRAETLLLNLFRGAGATGLAGLPRSRALGGMCLLRPLMELPRATLGAWAALHQLRWIEDESNHDLRYRRNHVRQKLLPVIAEVFPGVVPVLARTAAQLQEQMQLLDRLAESEASTCRDTEGCLSVARLQLLPESALRNLLRYKFGKAGVQIPSARRLMALAAQILSATTDSESFVRMGAVGVHLWRDHVWLDRAMDQPLPEAAVLAPGEQAWPDGTLMVAMEAANLPKLQVRPVGQGQRFQPMGRCRDAVTELLRAKDVPPWTRARLPGIWSGDTLIWVAMLGPSAAGLEVGISDDSARWAHVPSVCL